jgi:hypothetical protein
LEDQEKVVNQSFLFCNCQNDNVDKQWDSYVANFGTVFASGIGNSDNNDGHPCSPATAYNVIGVAAYGGSSGVGPTTDLRSKPDITAPESATSYSTPLVSGCAAIMVQAANIVGTANASNPLTVKALLLNGAVKPLNQANPDDNWTHTATAPLDTRYGAGVLNVFNSYMQLQGGENQPTASNTTTSPIGISGNLTVHAGWDFRAIESTATEDKVNHYFVDLRNEQASSFTVTTTLVWQRHQNVAGINNLDLFLYAEDGTQIALSNSMVDNVEHIFVQNLPTGRYDLEVFKRHSDTVSDTETYALAFNFAPVQLISAVSRKAHGSGGPSFDIPLPITDAPGVECRAAGPNNSYQIVLSFLVPITIHRCDANIAEWEHCEYEWERNRYDNAKFNRHH